MESVRVEITPGGRASRLEVIVRFLYYIILAITTSIFGFITGIVVFINFFTCLLLAERVASAYLAKFTGWITMIYSYMFFITDERPPIHPL